MTIREHLRRKNRLYRIDQGVCLFLAVVGVTAIFVREANDPTVEPSYFLILLSGMAFLAFFAAIFIPFIRLRCPQWSIGDVS